MCSVIWWDSRILPFLLKLQDNFTLTRTRAFYIWRVLFFKGGGKKDFENR